MTGACVSDASNSAWLPLACTTGTVAFLEGEHTSLRQHHTVLICNNIKSVMLLITKVSLEKQILFCGQIMYF